MLRIAEGVSLVFSADLGNGERWKLPNAAFPDCHLRLPSATCGHKIAANLSLQRAWTPFTTPLTHPAFLRYPSENTLMYEYTIRQILDLVPKGLVRVPAFQRGFVWDSEMVAFLMDSIYKGYPTTVRLTYSGVRATD